MIIFDYGDGAPVLDAWGVPLTWHGANLNTNALPDDFLAAHVRIVDPAIYNSAEEPHAIDAPVWQTQTWRDNPAAQVYVTLDQWQHYLSAAVGGSDPTYVYGHPIDHPFGLPVDVPTAHPMPYTPAPTPAPVPRPAPAPVPRPGALPPPGFDAFGPGTPAPGVYYMGGPAPSPAPAQASLGLVALAALALLGMTR